MFKKPAKTVHPIINRFLGVHPKCRFPELALALLGICPKETGAKLKLEAESYQITSKHDTSVY